ncbi:deoxynucleoside kinase [Candidatus Woesearchaeota archaeon]|nr:deoxynucleoside kinase [Candidatus Woesearchaeota archaeon]
MSKGKLLVLEGSDGAGKSTQIKLITQYLKEKNLKIDFLHFPMYGHNSFSDLIARFLRGEFGDIDNVDPYFVANIYAMDRYAYLPELNKKLEENDVIILDRYVFSNIAFQAAKYTKENIEKAHEISEWIKSFEFDFLNLPYPDLTLFLDNPIDVVKERLEKEREGDDRDYLEGKQDIHEADIDFQSRVRDNYLILKLQEEPDYYVIPCAHKHTPMPVMNTTTGEVHQSPSTWEVLTPSELFTSYKNYIDDVL